MYCQLILCGPRSNVTFEIVVGAAQNQCPETGMIGAECEETRRLVFKSHPGKALKIGAMR